MGFDESRAFDKLVGQWGILSATGLNAWGTCVLSIVPHSPWMCTAMYLCMYVSEVHHSKP